MGKPIDAIGGDKSTNKADAWQRKMFKPKTEVAPEGGALSPAFLPNGGTFLDAVKGLGTDAVANTNTW